MPKKVLHKFHVESVQVMDEHGNIDKELMPHDLDEEKLKQMYHYMFLAREFDDKLFKLQRAGKIGTFGQVKGQEAAQIGSAFALEKDDWMVPSFREESVNMVRGADRAKLVQGWRGDTRAFESDPKTARDLPVAIPIGSQALHAVGIAWASKLKSEKNATICYFGDGATSEGDVLEAFNFAGVFQAPIVFFVQNNQWAISTPRTKQTHAESIAQKAIAFGFQGIQVDGNDIMGVYKVTKEALEKARNGGGPTLIEAITFRIGDHTTSDDATKYRPPEVVEQWKKKCPILRLQKYFEKHNMFTEDYKSWVINEVENEVKEAVDKGLAIEPPGPEELYKHVYSELPQILLKEKKELLQELKEKEV